MNYNSELAFGIENRAEVGIQYGSALSLSIKALVWREDIFWPDMVFGARNLFASQEGGDLRRVRCQDPEESAVRELHDLGQELRQRHA